MYIRRKVYSYSEPEEQLYSVTMTEEEYNLFSDFKNYVDYLEQREFAWQDSAGNIWKGAQGDKSQGLANVIGEIGEKEKISKGKFGKGAYQGGTGANSEVSIAKKTKRGLTAAEQEALAEQKKALAAQNKELETIKKEARANWKTQHTKANMKAVKSSVASKKVQLAESAANRARIAKQAQKQLLKKGGKIAGGVALGGAALGAGIYGYKKVANKA